MENKIYGRVYLITNLINNKQYVGQTTLNIQKRFKYHCNKYQKPIITKAIIKYGKENFKIEEIAIAYNQEQLNFTEGFYIKYFNTLVPNGYNITNIINGKGKLSEKTKEKIRIASSNPENIKRLSEYSKKNRGKNRSMIYKYCGVRKKNKKYYSRISVGEKEIHLGVYNTEINAAKSYDIAAIKYFGSDTNLNFPELREDYINNNISIKTDEFKLKSGIKGIWFHKNTNKWKIKYFNKILNKNHVKYFDTIDEAIIFKNNL